MPPKRKSAPVSSQSSPVSKKSRNTPTSTPAKKASKSIDPQTFYTQTIEQVFDLNDDEDERQLASPFIKLPSKKLYPDYFSIVKSPFTISEIQKKNSKGKYAESGTEEFEEDFRRIFENASLYNDPGSWIVGDAKTILEFVQEKIDDFKKGKISADHESVSDEEGEKEDLDDDEDEAPAPKLSLKLKRSKKEKEKESEEPDTTVSVAELPELASALIKNVRDHKFPGLGLLSDPFLDDIDRKEYPDYFKIIEHPTSFSRVLGNIKKKGYFSPSQTLEENLQTLYDDTVLIFNNAQLYNDPSSLIHQDSVKLQNYFEEKFEELKAKVLGKTEPTNARGGKLRLKLKATPKPPVEEPKKLTIKIERRGRKKKVVEPVKIESEKEEEEEEENDQDEEDEDNKEIEGNEEEAGEADANGDQDGKSEPILDAEYNAMGKTSKKVSPEESFIQSVSLCSSSNTIAALQQKQQHQHQQGLQPQTLASITKSKQLKYSLFPSHTPISSSILFEYKFPTQGYEDSSYTLSLPQDATSLVSLKISLHKAFYDLKKPTFSHHEFVNSSDEDFQCRLFLNDEEVNTGGEIFEGEKEGEDFLNFQYDLKLSQGLNILSFELKVAPTITKKVKKSSNKENEDESEAGGRYTRHQMQQMKMSWNVEKFNFIVCNNS